MLSPIGYIVPRLRWLGLVPVMLLCCLSGVVHANYDQPEVRGYFCTYSGLAPLPMPPYRATPAEALADWGQAIVKYPHYSFPTFTNWYIGNYTGTAERVYGRCRADNGIPPGQNGHNGTSGLLEWQMRCSLDTPQGPVSYGSQTGFFFNGQIRYACRSASRPAPELDPKNLATPRANGGVCTGNPINCGDANKFQRETDYASPGTFGLQFERHYNSTTARRAPGLGPQWWHSYFRRIEPLPGNRAAALRPDGRILTFSLPGATLPQDSDLSDRLERLTNSGGTQTGWRYTNASGDERETYDLTGRLLSIAHRSGLTLTLAYSTSTTPASIAPGPGLLISVSDGRGRSLSFTYGINGEIARMTDPAGGSTHYTYDTAGRLSRVTWPDGTFRTHHYNELANTAGANLPFALTGVTDERGVRLSTYRYDSTGRPVSTERAGSVNRHEVAYPGSTSRTVTDPLGVVRTYTFAIIANTRYNTAITGPVCPSCGPAARTYDANGNLASSTDWNGFRTTYTFDLTRNLETSRTEALNGNGTARPETRTIQTDWHPTFRLPTKVTERNSANVALRETTLGYDAQGNLVYRSVRDVASSQLRTWTWTHTYSTTIPGLIVQTVLDGPRLDVADTTTWTFDPVNGNLLSKSERVNASLSLVTTYGNHDAHGNARTITDPNGVVTTLVFDARQRLTSTTTAGETTTLTYDAAGLLDRVTQPDGSFLDFTHDDAQRLVRVEDAAGGRIEYTLDAMGNRTREDVRDVNGTLRQTRSRVFSTLNRLVQEIGALGQVTAMAYDNDGNLTAIDGPLAGTADTTTRTFDALNRLIRTTAPDGGQVNVTLNALDQATQIVDPRTLATAYAQNAFGDVATQSSPDTGVTTRTFDAAGNVLTETDAAGRTTTRTWDALNRMLTEVHVQAGRPTLSLGFTYDQGTHGLGRLTGFTDPSGSTVLEYDARGRLSVRRQTVAGVTTELRFTRDAQGRLSEMRYPSGRQVRYGYDLRGRVNRIDLAGQPILQAIAYHPFGPAVSGTYWNGVAWSRPLDTDGRVQSYRTGNATIHVPGYDLASRITSITQPAPWANHTFGYDTSDRLISWSSGTTSYAWTFDLNGNRRTQTVGGNVQASTFIDPPTAGASNRLQAVSNVTPPRAFTFDPSGRTTADGLRTLVHDARGRLSQVTAAGGTTSFTINALGERITKSGPLTPGGTNVFHYDPTGKLIATSVAGQDNWTDILYLGNTPVAMLTGAAATPAISILQADHLDTVVSIMNAAAVQVWRWDRDPYGAFLPNEDPDGDGNLVRFDLRFPGQVLDRETGLHYNYFRDYDPAIGRYVQSDPIGFAGGVNTYGYVGANPLSYTDRRGLYAGIAVGVGVRAAGGRAATGAIGAGARDILGPTIGGIVACALAGVCTFNESDESPARGLPPAGIKPPVEGECKPGPASRPAEQKKGGRSLWDERGGEWRWFPGDRWHNPHWDYNRHDRPSSAWENIPHGGLPPVKK